MSAGLATSDGPAWGSPGTPRPAAAASARAVPLLSTRRQTTAPARGDRPAGGVLPATVRGRSAGGPRLLLPPRAAPEGALPLPLSIPLPPPVRSVLSPVTEGSWPVPAPLRAVTHAAPDDPTRLCGSIVLAAVEALRGTRPLAQLTRWVSPEVLEHLGSAAANNGAQGPSAGSRTQVARAGATTVGAVTAAPGRPTRATVRRTHLTRVSPTVAEASVVLHDGDRLRAAAVRMEVHRGHWRATVLQIG